MYYRHRITGMTLTEAEYRERVEKRIKERLADEEEFDDYLHDEYNAIEIFNFTDEDRDRVSKQFKEDVRKWVEESYSCDYRCLEGEPTDIRKVRITIKEYRTDIRELPQSDFDGEDMRYETLSRLRIQYGDDADIMCIEDVDTDMVYYEE